MPKPRLPSQQRKRRVRIAKSSPFPVPIEMVTGEAAASSNWIYYTAALGDNSVMVVHTGDMDLLYRMGFFGKGGMSRGQPEWSDHWRIATLPWKPAEHGGWQTTLHAKVTSRRRYMTHLGWRLLSTGDSAGVEKVRQDQDYVVEEAEQDRANLPHQNDHGEVHLATTRETQYTGACNAQAKDQCLDTPPADEEVDATVSGTDWERSKGDADFWGMDGAVPMQSADSAAASWDTSGPGDAAFWGTDDAAIPDPSDGVLVQSANAEACDGVEDLEDCVSEAQRKEASDSQPNSQHCMLAGRKETVETDAHCLSPVSSGTGCSTKPSTKDAMDEEPSKDDWNTRSVTDRSCVTESAFSRLTAFEASTIPAQSVHDGKSVCRLSSKEQSASPPDQGNTSRVTLAGKLLVDSEANENVPGYLNLDKSTVSSEANENVSGGTTVSEALLGGEVTEDVSGDLTQAGPVLCGEANENASRTSASEPLGGETNENAQGHLPESRPLSEWCVHDDDDVLPSSKKTVFVVGDSDDDEQLADGRVCRSKTRWRPVVKHDPFLMDEMLHLSYEEAFFLSYGLGCLSVLDSQQKPMDMQQLWRECCRRQQDFLPNYIAYHYYRSRNWVPKTGLKFGCTFLLYRDGPPFYHGSYSVVVKMVDDQGRPLLGHGQQRQFSWTSLAGLKRITEHVGKDLMLCYVIKPAELSAEDMLSPACIPRFQVKEMVVSRWVSSQEREGKALEEMP